MGRFTHRSQEEELMDDLDSSGEVINQTLRELETINRLLGGNQVTINGLKKLTRGKADTLIIADLGCGGGDMLILIAKWARKNKIKVELIGYDANPSIIAYAENNCRDYHEISFEVMDIFSDDFRALKFDIVLCTLFTHHFTNESLLEIFGQFKSQATKGVIINDLHRHWFAYHSIKLLTQFFSKSEMVKYDGPLSVLRAFKREELIALMGKAGIKEFSLKWKWAFRWQLLF